MVSVETIGKIRRAWHVQGKSIRSIAKSMGVSRNTVRKVLRSGELAPLAGPVVMLGFGGAYRLSPRTAIEVAISEGDGSRHAAADFGVHVTLHWEP